MIQSMTGYGRASNTFGDKKILVEIKTLNSKALDLSAHITSAYREREMELRTLVSKAVERGKVDFNLWTEREEQAVETPLNAPLLGAYHKQLKCICEEQAIPMPVDPWTVLLRLPDVMAKAEAQREVSDEEWQAVRQTVEQALGQLLEFRTQEGAALERKFREKTDRIAELLRSVEPYEKLRIEKIRQRITDALQSLADVNYDRNRLEQEMIYYIEKLDVSEEKQRLTNHLRYFTETLESGHGQGKKLGFIAQEMGREINTLGSKSNLAEMQNIVVMMKDELEQIKEQVLNVL